MKDLQEQLEVLSAPVTGVNGMLQGANGAQVTLDLDGATEALCAALTLQKEAQQFKDELLDHVECLSDVAETHGVRTLTDLFYLHAAVMSGSYIDFFEGGESRILEFVEDLPSAAKWKTFIKVELLPESVRSQAMELPA